MKKNLVMPCIAHFFVDFACIALVMNRPDKTFGAVLLYNAIAFCLQPLAGYMQDMRPNAPFATIGILFVCASLLIKSPVAAAIGNALFHVGGAKLAVGSLKKGGFYVSFGAIGVGLALSLAPSHNLWLVLPMAILAMTLLPMKAQPSESFIGADFQLLALALMAVALRGWLSAALMPKSLCIVPVSLAVGLFAFFGKALGGCLAEYIGEKKAGLAFALASFGFMLIGTDLALLVSIAFFNAVMPLTLEFARRSLPGLPSFAFGLTAACLFWGSLMARLVSLSPLSAAACALACMGLILFASKAGEGREALRTKA